MSGGVLSASNQQKLTRMQCDIVTLFRGAVNDVLDILGREEQEWNPLDGASFEHTKDDNGEVAVFEFTQNPNKARDRAEELRRDYSYAFTICANAGTLAEEGPEMANKLIAKWGRSQMLLAWPDIIEEENSEVQQDIADFLARADERLQGIKTSRTKDTEERAKDFFKAVQGMGIDQLDLMKLDSALDILEEVQFMAVDKLNASLRAPS